MRPLLAVIVSGAVLAACGRNGPSPETTATAPAPAGGTPVVPVEKGAAVQLGAQKIAQERQQTVPPVAFEQLTGVLGEVDGWTRSAPTGEQIWPLDDFAGAKRAPKLRFHAIDAAVNRRGRRGHDALLETAHTAIQGKVQEQAQRLVIAGVHQRNSSAILSFREFDRRQTAPLIRQRQDGSCELAAGRLLRRGVVGHRGHEQRKER